ncbi:hypothetical protein AB4093_33900, partial [Inquilinus sp. 2KB_12]|uniref:hypothetical protein n=1 Tax=Inquilinus sp. 2KB_12 TaxID=3232975 RepID=UPI003F90089F
RNVLQKIVEHAILVLHGVALCCPETLPDVRDPAESTPCTLSTKLNRTLVGLTRGSRGFQERLWPPLDATVKPWHDKVKEGLPFHFIR